MLEMWNHWGLADVLRELVEDGESAISATDVICALTIQRCVAPGSKLYAQRWFPTTVLPELLGISSEQFHNTRIHRVLQQLHECTPVLQERLVALYQREQVAFAALFLDVTDAYFEGRGCEMAKPDRTKAGHRNKRCIGVVLAANTFGHPMRWEVVPGKTKDPVAMGTMIDTLGLVRWLKHTPVVCDRAMGRRGAIERMLRNGIRFLTAVPVNTIESHTVALPHGIFAEVEIEGSETAYRRDVARIAQAARQAGMEEDGENLFVMDLGVVEPQPLGEPEPVMAPKRSQSSKPTRKPGRLRGLGAQVRFAQQLAARLEAGEFPHQKALAHHVGLTPARVSSLLQLLRLAPDIQEPLAKCPHPDVFVPLERLLPAVRGANPEEQRRLLSDVLEHLVQCDGAAGAGPSPTMRPPFRLRLLAYFNPRMFVDQRRRAREHLNELYRFVDELNQELANAKRSRDEGATCRKILRKLERDQEVAIFDISVDPLELTSAAGNPIHSFQCALELNPALWAKRRRYDGFVLLLAHPDLPHNARQLARLYRAKDAVEKDFQTIKNVTKLLPIYHYTDPKVQAHVTLCMLALLLQRTLEDRLSAKKVNLTAPASLEILSTCHLNQIRPASDVEPYFSVTKPTAEQRHILDALDLNSLVDERVLSQTLTTRV